jgi:hypothetical protein
MQKPHHTGGAFLLFRATVMRLYIGAIFFIITGHIHAFSLARCFAVCSQGIKRAGHECSVINLGGGYVLRPGPAGDKAN